MAGPLDPFSSEQVRRAQSGDEAALERLLTATEPILRGYFIKRIGRGPDVDDLVQNTLVRLHGGLGDLEKPESLKAFAMKAALFELQDYYRGRYTMKEHLYAPDAPPEDPGRDAPAGAEIDLERALAALSPTARRIMELRAYGYRYREIAQVIGSTEAAIKMQVKRAFERMRDALAGALLAGVLAWWWLRGGT